jgi:hypothetical protein
MLFSTKLAWVMIIIILTIPGTVGRAIAGPCDCANYELKGTDEKPEISWVVKVIEQGTLLYKDESSQEYDRKLGFNESFYIIKKNDDRMQVRAIGKKSPSGWVQRSALLCSPTPMKGELGLEEKFYIKTETEVRKKIPTTVKAYPSLERSDCEGSCRELSRFSGYFIFDKRDDRYLLSENYRHINDTDVLTGWVDKDNGFVWDTAYGLRPGENLVLPNGSTNSDGKDVSGQERAICAYRTISDAISGTLCIPLLGGSRWYKSDLRIPILARVDEDGKALRYSEKPEDSGKQFYKVVMPLAGYYIEKKEAGQLITTKKIGSNGIVDPDQFSEPEGIENIRLKKNVDILFLIDGTLTMNPYIDAIRGTDNKKGVIQEIIRTFHKKPEIQYRFGFRIYRDKYAGKNELGEGLMMSTNCEFNENNKSEFDEEIEKVKVTSSDIAKNDDYPENLFGGIEQAIEDLIPCQDNMKILFVIGDHGYDKKYQKKIRGTFVDLNDFIYKLKGDKKTEDSNIVTFFIQTPNSGTRKTPRKNIAYKLFTDQANDILKRILPPERHKSLGNYFMISTDEDLIPKIVSGVAKFSQPKLINDLIVDLRGGHSFG